MKKVIWITFAVSLLLSGCGKADPTDVDITNNSIETEASENTIPTYSAEEDAAAAEYLVSEYGIDLSEAVPKVILDCDRSYLYDDAMCMCILVQAVQKKYQLQIKLLGCHCSGSPFEFQRDTG